MQFVSLAYPCADFFQDIFFGRDDDLTAPFLPRIAVLPETVVLECACGEEVIRERSDKAVTDALMERFASSRYLRFCRRFGNEFAVSLPNVDMAELFAVRLGFLQSLASTARCFGSRDIVIVHRDARTAEDEFIHEKPPFLIIRYVAGKDDRTNKPLTLGFFVDII